MKSLVAWFKVTFMYGLVVPEYKAVHWVWDYESVLEWVECYPADTLIIPCGLIGDMWNPVHN